MNTNTIIAVCGFLVACVSASAGPRPEFIPISDSAGGSLAFASHTVAMCENEPFKDDSIIDDPKADAYDIGLSWSTKPEPKTDSVMMVTYYWSIPPKGLTEPRYILEADQTSPRTIVFVLRAAESRKIVRKSPPCQLQQGYRCDIKDIAKHISVIRPEDLQTNTEQSQTLQRTLVTEPVSSAESDPRRR